VRMTSNAKTTPNRTLSDSARRFMRIGDYKRDW
jgi:hypothetical protein